MMVTYKGYCNLCLINKTNMKQLDTMYIMGQRQLEILLMSLSSIKPKNV